MKSYSAVCGFRGAGHFHLALNLVREEGQVSFITTNYYPTATGAKKLRADFKQRATVRRLVNLNELRIFESALGQHNMITVLTKVAREDSIAHTCVTARQGFATADVLTKILLGNDEDTSYYQLPSKDLFSGQENYIRIRGDISVSNDPIASALTKMRLKGVPLSSVCRINCGIQTGCDHIKDDSGRDRGVFVLDRSEYREIPAKERPLLKPFFKNSDIGRYSCSTHNDLWVIYTDRRFDQPEDYPAIIAHLKKFRERLSNIREVRNGIIQYYQLQWPREERIFTDEKLIAPQRSRTNTFAYSDSDWYASVDVYFITSRDQTVSLKYVLALLNSKLYLQWLYREGKRKGEALELYQQPLSEVPIPRITPREQTHLIDLVDQILEKKRLDDLCDTTSLEAEIDELVYSLFALSEEEILAVNQKDEQQFVAKA